jgi:hypothetical protein
MGKHVSRIRKKECLKFIRTNFDKISQREMARKLNVGKTTINRWSRETGLIFRKPTVNEDFFDKFDENSSYILGFIFADGNVCWDPRPRKCYRAITITAAEKDKDHLERMRKIMNSTKPLLYSPKTKSYRLIINSKKLCLKLMKLGVVPRKSLIVDFPRSMPNSQLRHFLRGVIDGDGWRRYVKRKRSPYFEVSICSGSKKFSKGFAKAVLENVGVDTNIRQREDNLYIIRYTCSRAKLLAEFIYSDAKIFLQRKYLHYEENIL